MSIHPNLLIVLTRGFRSDAMSDERAWPLSTAHLEALSRRGIRLAASAASTADPQALDTLLTGLHARQLGDHLEELCGSNHQIEPDERPMSQRQLKVSVAQYLQQAGYHTAGVGLVRPIITHLDESVCIEDVDVIRQPRSVEDAYYRHCRKEGLLAAIMQQRVTRQKHGPFAPDRLLLEPADDIDGFITRQTLNKIKTMPTDKPWALFVSFSGPDNQLPAPPLYDSLVNPKHLMDGCTIPDFRKHHPMVQPVYLRTQLQRLEARAVARIRADYLARVGMIDYAMRQIVGEMDQREDCTNTWTCFTSNRGTLLGEHGLIGHQSFYNAAVQVPLVIAPPRSAPMPHDAIPDGLFSTVDFAATLCDLASVKLPKEVTGRSLLPLLGSVLDDVDDPMGGLLCEFEDRTLLETHRYKAIYNRGSNQPTAVFDLLADEDEKKNLVDSQLGEDIAEMMMLRLEEATGALPLPHFSA